MEFAHACRGVGVRPIHGVELTVDGRARHPAGRVRGRLAQPLPADHRGPRRDPAEGGDGERAAAVAAARRSSSGTPRGWSASPAAPATALVAGRWERGDPRGAERWRGGCSPRSGPTASGSSCSGRCGGATAPATAGSPRSPSALGVPCVATGDAHAHDRSRLALQDALVAVRLGATLDETEGVRRGNSAAALLSPPGRRPASATTPRRWPRRPPGRAPALRPHQRPRLQLSRAPRTPTPTGASPSSAGRGWTSATRSGPPERPPRSPPPSARGRAAAGRGAGADPRAAALRLLPAPPRHARAGARGRARGAGPRTRRGGCCRPAAAAAPASARSSAT